MQEIVEESRQIIERGSKSFAAAARIFDSETRASAGELPPAVVDSLSREGEAK